MNNNQIVILIVGVILAFGLLLYYIKFIKTKPIVKAQKKTSPTSGAGNLAPGTAEDNSIDIPLKDIVKPPTGKKLSLKERIELSWQFLYKITEIIVSRFSKEDKAVLEEVGKTLIKNGMKYEHVVDLAIGPANAQQTVKETSKGKSGVGV